MSFLSPLGFLALLGVPAIVALHLFRRRPPTRRVSALFLFATGAVRSETGRRRTRLRNSASLVLELLALLAIALWLAEPRAGLSGEPPRVCIVLDGSASMAAIGSDGRSAQARARAAVESVLDALPEDSDLTVVVTGPRPEVIAGPAGRKPDVREGLARWIPRQTRHDFAPAVELAMELGGARADVILFTDGEWAAAPDRLRVLGVGEPRANAAIASARRLRLDDEAVDGGQARVLCDIATFGGLRRAKIAVVGDDGVVRAEQDIELEIDTPRHVTIDLPDEDVPWLLRLTASGDALAIDNSCALPPPTRRTVRVGVSMSAPWRAMLEIDRALGALGGVAETDPAEADLILAEIPAVAGERAHDRAHELVVRALPGDTDAWIGPFLVDRREPLASGLTLDGVVWTAGKGALPGAPFVLVGDQPLASLVRTPDDRLRVFLDLDVERSNFQRSPDWPILLQNVVEVVRNSLPGPERSIVPVGGTARWRGAATGVRFEGPDGGDVLTAGDRVRFFEVREPGLYRVIEGTSVRGFVAAWFVDLTESELRTRSSFERVPGTPVAAEAVHAGVGTDRERRILALLVLVALLADVVVTRRRRQEVA